MYTSRFARGFMVCCCLVLAWSASTMADEVTAAKTTTPITVDGAETGTEWNGASVINIAGPPAAVVKLKTYHDPATHNEEIYVLVTVTDNTNNNTDDKIRLFLDMLHDKGPTADDVGFEVTRGGQMNKLTGSASAPTTVVGWVPAVQQVVVTSTNTQWIAEMKVKASAPDLGAAFLPSIMGLSIYVKDQPTGAGFPNEIFWPITAGDPFDPSTWADFKTRNPIEYMMVLDQSGSMLDSNKWNSATNAANILANTLVALKDASFADQVGLVTFASNCSNDAPKSVIANSIATIPSGFPGKYVNATNPDPNNCTPIIDGINLAFGSNQGALQLVSDPNKPAERVVLLLTDGLHNSPRSEVPPLPSHLIYDPCPSGAWGPCPGGTVSRVQANAVAVGSDADVDTVLINRIKARFAGQIFPPIYNISSDPEALKSFFINSLQDLFQVNLIPADGAGTNQFTLNTAERKLIVLLSWKTPASAASVTLQRQPLGGGTFTNVPCVTSQTEAVAVGYSICIVNSPQAGTYQALVGGVTPTADTQFNMVDPNLAATFAIDQKQHGTGQDIVLTARLNEAGVPVTNDASNHPVKVTVAIRRPGEAFGTFVSTHRITDCAQSEPQLPPIDPRSTFARSVALASSTGVEPKAARFVKMDALLKACNKAGLEFIEDPGTDLYDDGTHGDVTANDGIYTLRFLNTQYEGSYVFRFKATGTSPSHSNFGRIKTQAEYVRVNVDPGQTTFRSRVYQQAGNIVTREYFMIPRDRFGGYLGPGFPEEIHFNTTAGTFISPIVDYNNGIYSQFLRYDSTTDNPVVSGTAEGKPLPPLGAGAGKRFELVLPFVGGSFFHGGVGLDPGVVLGVRFGFFVKPQLVLEAEHGVTFTESGQVHQVLGNVRFDLKQLQVHRWTPFVTAGSGAVLFQGFGVNGQVFAFHGGGGVTYQFKNSFGVRFDERIFRINSFMGSGATVNFQTTGGLVFWF
jgi:hypothetical protein